MNILFWRYGSICEPDIIDGFTRLGHTVTEVKYEITDKAMTGEQYVKLLSDALFNGSYSFVFSINYYPVFSEVCTIFKIPYLCWTVDSPVMQLHSTCVESPYNRIFLFDSKQYKEIAHRNPECIFHLPLATNIERWSNVIENASPKDHAKFAKEVAFVGSLYSEKNPYNRFDHKPDYLDGYLEGLIEAQLKVYGYNFLEEVLTDEMVNEFKKVFPGFYTFPEKTYPNDIYAMAQLYLGSEITVRERIRLLDAIGKRHQVDLFTFSDTTGMSVNNCGGAQTLTEMPLIFHDSKINLNMTAKGIQEGIPLRVFDVLGCGGFLISNYQNEIPWFLNPDEDIVLYESMEDLLAKVDYYMEHPAMRKEIAANGFEHVKNEHTYEIRLQQMLNMAFS